MGRPLAALIFFDCATRLRLMGDEAAKDIDYVRNIIGLDTALMGMFSFGEVATPPEGGMAAFYNKTVVACALA